MAIKITALGGTDWVAGNKLLSADLIETIKSAQPGITKIDYHSVPAITGLGYLLSGSSMTLWKIPLKAVTGDEIESITVNTQLGLDDASDASTYKIQYSTNNTDWSDIDSFTAGTTKQTINLAGAVTGLSANLIYIRCYVDDGAGAAYDMTVSGITIHAITKQRVTFCATSILNAGHAGYQSSFLQELNFEFINQDTPAKMHLQAIVAPYGKKIKTISVFAYPIAVTGENSTTANVQVRYSTDNVSYSTFTESYAPADTRSAGGTLLLSGYFMSTNLDNNIYYVKTELVHNKGATYDLNGQLNQVIVYCYE